MVFGKKRLRRKIAQLEHLKDEAELNVKYLRNSLSYYKDFYYTYSREIRNLNVAVQRRTRKISRLKKTIKELELSNARYEKIIAKKLAESVECVYFDYTTESNTNEGVINVKYKQDKD